MVNRILRWWIRRQHFQHKVWLKRHRVLMPPPQRQCERNSTECAGRV
jgi:hypothetical protein